MHPDGTTQKFVAALNRSYELPRLLSGMGHVTAGLVAGLTGTRDLRMLEYLSSDGVPFPGISDWPFIALKGRGGQLRTLRQALVDHGLPCVAYLDTMLDGGTEVEMAATAERKLADLEILALATFGPADAIDALTKRLSLWR